MLPNLIIIGAQKCGTTSLHYYLKHHPEVLMSQIKELNFFNEQFNWQKGMAWYEAQFSGEAKIYGEASPHYTNYPMFPGVVAKMHALVPKARLIYLVRDPIDRMVSQYLDYVKGYHEKRAIEEAFKDSDNNEYFARSRYYFQLGQYLKFFSPEQIFVESAENLMNDREPTLKKIYRFLGVDENFRSDKITEEKNVNEKKLKQKKPRRWVRYVLSDKFVLAPVKKVFPETYRDKVRKFLLPKAEPVERPVISNALKERLGNILKEDVDKLRAFTGISFSEWNI